MIIYNETIIVDEQIHHEWLQWVQTVHIPGVMATGCFEANRMLKVLDSPNEGVTYCIQYHTSKLENYDQFKVLHQHKLLTAHHHQFENMFVLFNTLMQTLN